MTNIPIATYINLMRRYNEKDISTKDFEREYLMTFKSDQEIKPEREFLILDRLFSDVDAYTDLSGVLGGIDEDQLRGCVKAAYEKLTQHHRPAQ